MSGLILASASPQRRAILDQVGIPYEAVSPDVEEETAGDPRDLVIENARRKARAIAVQHPSATILACDTEVALDGQVLGKPPDEASARDALEGLSGRAHTVWSGVCLLEPDSDEQSGVASTEVRFRELEPSLVDWYLASGEWRERAGGYAIQGRGAALIESVHGDYLNVVGLPLATLLDLVSKRTQFGAFFPR